LITVELILQTEFIIGGILVAHFNSTKTKNNQNEEELLWENTAIPAGDPVFPFFPPGFRSAEFLQCKKLAVCQSETIRVHRDRY
jgi:hypothetical protein